jgi:hypothetical protein
MVRHFITQQLSFTSTKLRKIKFNNTSPEKESLHKQLSCWCWTLSATEQRLIPWSWQTSVSLCSVLSAHDRLHNIHDVTSCPVDTGILWLPVSELSSNIPVTWLRGLSQTLFSNRNTFFLQSTFCIRFEFLFIFFSELIEVL